VSACIDAADAVPGLALRQQLIDALAQSGVTSDDVAPETPFDPQQHKAADTRITDQERLAGLVAETERPGFTDRGRRLRWPEVIVYQTESWSSRGN
jgi:molecular chaperone GrpE (heat shock protein)